MYFAGIDVGSLSAESVILGDGGIVAWNIIRARPNESLFQRRLGNRENATTVCGKGVVKGKAARVLLLLIVIGAQIGADNLPAIASIRRLMHVLASNVYSVVVVR